MNWIDNFVGVEQNNCGFGYSGFDCSDVTDCFGSDDGFESCCADFDSDSVLDCCCCRTVEIWTVDHCCCCSVHFASGVLNCHSVGMMVLLESCLACCTFKLTVQALVDTSYHCFDSIGFDNRDFHHSFDHFGNHFESSVDRFESLIAVNSVDFENHFGSSVDCGNHLCSVVESSVDFES